MISPYSVCGSRGRHCHVVTCGYSYRQSTPAEVIDLALHKIDPSYLTTLVVGPGAGGPVPLYTSFMSQDNPSQAVLRASDADRDQVAELLNAALADGRLTDEEHRQRLDQLYASKTHADLAPLTSDLTLSGSHLQRRQPTQPSPVERVRPQVAILSSSMARPTGHVGGRISATGLLGSACIDLSYATINEGGVEIVSNAVLGTVDIVVPAEARVKMTGFPLLGSLSPTVKPGPSDGPQVKVKGTALLGSVTIHRAKPEQSEG